MSVECSSVHLDGVSRRLVPDRENEDDDDEEDGADVMVRPPLKSTV